ncbi:MAG TPA: substrate-binding domain-containing protein [Terriglobales bacterium]|jgi:Ca-activated chloride channel family protein|nr:substrate-binding domain-containing protein [Terriglobales bacterium]
MRRLVILPLACGLLLAACSQSSPPPGPRLSVLAGSELKDIEPLLPKVQQRTGVRLELRYTGTLEAVDTLQAGEALDLAWLSSNKYALLTPGVKERVRASERTMITPVVLGLKASKARALGWADNPNVTWKDIAEAAGKGRFTFGMTSPTASNTGFSGLLGLAAALSGKGDALDVSDIDGKQLAAFFKAQRLTAGSSGWLADAYLKDQDQLDGMINYANVLLAMNRGGKLHEPFALIYPKEGILTADYPLMLINAGQREAYEKIVAYVRSAEFQKAILETTLRRPINPEVQVEAGLYPTTLIELPFPASYRVVNAILEAFDNEFRRPADATFVLDTSGSMEGARLDGLKTAMRLLTNPDPSAGGRYARFRQRERIVLVPFSSSPGTPATYTLGSADQANAQILARVRQSIDGLSAGGKTAVFSSVHQAYQDALARRRTDKVDRYYSIVVLTDGENNRGESWREFERWYQSLPPGDRGLRVFTILFGEGKPAEMESLAHLTGGRVFDSRTTALSAVFREIRAYQ